jgi:CubicO group peptidase (beta-lactamase class C family)
MKIKILFATLLTLELFTIGYAQTPDKAKLDQFFDRLAEKNKAMGSLTIARDGNVLYTRAIGYSQINGTEKKPLTSANRYRVGSITKMFTAAMILQLVEEGKLKLTDTLDKFFPQVPNAQKITIAQILAHRSGIHDIFRDRNLRPSSSPAAPVKFTITREGATLFIQPTGQSAAPLEATAQDKFRIEGAGVVFEFDAAKNQMIIKRSGGERVFTKDK